MTSSVRSRLALGLVAVLIPLLLLSLAEGLVRVGLRVLDGAWPVSQSVASWQRNVKIRRLYRLHPYLNATVAEGATVAVGGRSATVNSLGYRSPERALEKPPGVVRIVCAGGSTTFDLLAPSNEETWPWRLEQELRSRGAPVEVWNAGAPSWTSLESAISLLARDLDLAPDLVVLLQGFNDLQPAALRPFDRSYERHAALARSGLGFDLEPPGLLARSVLLDRLGAEFGRARAAGAMPGELAEEIDAVGLELFERNVRSFVALARVRGIAVALVTQPVRIRAAQREADLAYLEGWLQLEGDHVPAEQERMNDVLRRVASEADLPLIDAVAEIAWKDADFADPVHFAAGGSEKLTGLVAGRLADWLEAHVPPGPSAGAAE